MSRLAISISLVVFATACAVSDHHGSTEQHSSTLGSGDTPTPFNELTTIDFSTSPLLDGEFIEPFVSFCSSEINLACADDKEIQELLELSKKARAAAKEVEVRQKVRREAVEKFAEEAGVKMRLAGKMAVVVRNGDQEKKIPGVPYEIREQFKAAFTAANAGNNGGWVYDEDASNNIQGHQYLTQQELDQLVDATEKGAGDMAGMEAYRTKDDTYAVVQKSKTGVESILLYGYLEYLSNPRPHYTRLVLPPKWPDSYVDEDPSAKWFKERRWRSYVPKVQTFVGTDPAKTRDEMVRIAIDRAIADKDREDSIWKSENVYEVVKVLPIAGTIDALQRGDCPEAVASVLTDAAMLVGWGVPAKVIRIGRLKVPGVVAMIALDGGALGIRIAYKKDGAWVELVVTLAFQARALKRAMGKMLRVQRVRVAVAGVTLAALGIAADNAEKAIDEEIKAEDALLKARDELDKKRNELEKGLGFPPCGSAVSITPEEDFCIAQSDEGTLTDALSIATNMLGISPPVAAPVEDAEALAAVEEVRAEVLAMKATAMDPASTGHDWQAVCSARPIATYEPVIPTDEPLQLADGTKITTDAPTGDAPTTDPTMGATEPISAPVAPAPVEPAPAPHPSATDLVARYKAVTETLDKVRVVTRARKAEIDEAMTLSLKTTLAHLYGIPLDTMDKILEGFTADVMKEFEKLKASWTSDSARGTRLSYLVLLAGQALEGKSFNGVDIKLTGKDKEDAFIKLTQYRNDSLKNEITMINNSFFVIDSGMHHLVVVIMALPFLSEKVKTGAAITPAEWKQLGFPAPAAAQTITPQQWAAYLTKIDDHLTKLEAKVERVRKAILKE